MRFAILLLLSAHVLFACTPKYVTPATVPPGEARVEQTPLPPDAQTEALPPEFGTDQRSEGLEVGVKSPFSGILLGEALAARYQLIDTRYKELRVVATQDRAVWKAHRELYETRLQLADKAIRDLQPGWWERNAFSLGIVSGTFLGVMAGIAVALMAE